MNRLLIVVALILGTAEMTLGQAMRSAREGVFTEAQSGTGKTLYDERCASCHGNMALSAPDMAPMLNDPGFQNLWSKRSLAQLFGRIKESMPQDRPGSLSAQESADIVAYILNCNALPPGDTPLPADIEALKDIRLDAQDP